MVDPPNGAPEPLSSFGSGEAAAIPLAEHLQAALLINERRAGQYAAGLGIRIVTVPLFIVALRDRGILSERAARKKLALIEPITAKSIVDDAQRLLDALQDDDVSR